MFIMDDLKEKRKVNMDIILFYKVGSMLYIDGTVYCVLLNAILWEF